MKSGSLEIKSKVGEGALFLNPTQKTTGIYKMLRVEEIVFTREEHTEIGYPISLKIFI